MESVFDFNERKKREMIESYIAPNLPYENGKRETEITICDNFYQEPYYYVSSIKVAEDGKIIMNAMHSDDFDTYMVTRELERFDSDEILQVAGFFETRREMCIKGIREHEPEREGLEELTYCELRDIYEQVNKM